MDNPELRKKMGEFGRKRVEKELAWEHVSKPLLQAYESLTAERTERAEEKIPLSPPLRKGEENEPRNPKDRRLKGVNGHEWHE